MKKAIYFLYFALALSGCAKAVEPNYSSKINADPSQREQVASAVVQKALALGLRASDRSTVFPNNFHSTFIEVHGPNGFMVLLASAGENQALDLTAYCNSPCTGAEAIFEQLKQVASQAAHNKSFKADSVPLRP